MFVAVVCELASDDTRSDVYRLLQQYGFQRICKDVFESATVGTTTLARLKRDLDRLTDFYDKIRLYQYPIDGTLVITMLSDKRWRRVVMRT